MVQLEIYAEDVQMVNALMKATPIQMIEQMRNRVTIIPAAV